MRSTLYIAFCFLFVSCNEISLKKTDASSLLSEQVKAIDWTTIDTYPSFITCDSLADSLKEKKCFEKTLLLEMQKTLSDFTIQAKANEVDTIHLSVKVSEKGELFLNNIDSLNQFFNAEIWWKKIQNTLPKVYPAQKRGVPITVNFQVPLIIKNK